MDEAIGFLIGFACVALLSISWSLARIADRESRQKR
jgi:hypothetical protein